MQDCEESLGHSLISQYFLHIFMLLVVMFVETILKKYTTTSKIVYDEKK